MRLKSNLGKKSTLALYLYQLQNSVTLFSCDKLSHHHLFSYHEEVNSLLCKLDNEFANGYSSLPILCIGNKLIWVPPSSWFLGNHNFKVKCSTKTKQTGFDKISVT